MGLFGGHALHFGPPPTFYLLIVPSCPVLSLRFSPTCLPGLSLWIIWAYVHQPHCQNLPSPRFFPTTHSSPRAIKMEIPALFSSDRSSLVALGNSHFLTAAPSILREAVDPPEECTFMDISSDICKGVCCGILLKTPLNVLFQRQSSSYIFNKMLIKSSQATDMEGAVIGSECSMWVAYGI